MPARRTMTSAPSNPSPEGPSTRPSTVAVIPGRGTTGPTDAESSLLGPATAKKTRNATTAADAQATMTSRPAAFDFGTLPDRACPEFAAWLKTVSPSLASGCCRSYPDVMTQQLGLTECSQGCLTRTGESRFLPRLRLGTSGLSSASQPEGLPYRLPVARDRAEVIERLFETTHCTLVHSACMSLDGAAALVSNARARC